MRRPFRVYSTGTRSMSFRSTGTAYGSAETAIAAARRLLADYGGIDHYAVIVARVDPKIPGRRAETEIIVWRGLLDGFDPPWTFAGASVEEIPRTHPAHRYDPDQAKTEEVDRP